MACRVERAIRYWKVGEVRKTDRDKSERHEEIGSKETHPERENGDRKSS